MAQDRDIQGKPQQGATRRPGKPYKAPKLVKYGQVRSLTQVQTSGSSEGSSGSGVMKPSDRRLKERIVRIGTHPLGIGLYLFDYEASYKATHGSGRQFGVMADEVEKVMPRAVSMDAAGYQVVDYAMLGIDRAA